MNHGDRSIFDFLAKDMFRSLFCSEKPAQNQQVFDDERTRYRTSNDVHGLVIDVDLLNVDPRDITLWVSQTQVIIKGAGRGGSFTHRYTISPEYDMQKVEASMAHGTLRVRIARSVIREPRRVVIEFGAR